ncbi:thiamine-phosphate kinase [Alloprevotella tannerae]|uniref:thiamine-phosphate kinase n=1 Tax=Alloprevotella tannerae TaxID=76122 RepID=UPI001EDA1611|nr:thiamine-phosphate kinase [Alloprevotella tannerae]MCG2647560.1 thiamine-phosphate kinase [Alloprevotella tannerae]
MTDISTLGEFGLIRHLTKDLKNTNESTLKGVGDDCAVLSYPNKKVLITSDMLMDGIHFDLVYTPLKHLGYKAAQVNFSDVYAMNGTPRQLVVNLALSRRFSIEATEDLYAGIRLACERHGVDLVGGDTCSSLTGLAISITCIGEADESDIVYRNGAQENDLICVSGNLGAAYLGLQLMEREKRVFESQPKGAEAAQPDFAGREYLIERFLKPEARRDIPETLRKAQIHPTAMMDVSDGLSSELLHICKQSNCGCRIYEDRLPLDYQTAAAAEEFNLNVTTCALNGGEDYELLFTAPLSEYDKLKAIDDIRIIGAITKKEEGAQLVTRDGQEFPLTAQGFNAFHS